MTKGMRAVSTTQAPKAIGLAAISFGAGALMAFTKSKKHFIGITWDDAGKKGGAAFQADNNDYRGVLAGLEGIKRVDEDMAHADIGRGRAGGTSRNALVHRVRLAGLAEALLHQRHVLVAIIGVVETRPFLVRIHDADLEHGVLPAWYSLGRCRLISGAAGLCVSFSGSATTNGAEHSAHR